MLLKYLLPILLPAFSGLVSTTPLAGTPTACPTCPTPPPSCVCEGSPPPPGQSYLTRYPVCGARGFTQIPGAYVQTTYQLGNITLGGCRAACLATVTCESYGFAANYALCLFFDRLVRGVQLIQMDDSNFAHWDLSCHLYDYE